LTLIKLILIKKIFLKKKKNKNIKKIFEKRKKNKKKKKKNKK